jgi:hypothetical protein
MAPETGLPLLAAAVVVAMRAGAPPMSLPVGVVVWVEVEQAAQVPRCLVAQVHLAAGAAR